MAWNFAAWLTAHRGYIFLSIGLALVVVGLVSDVLGYRWQMNVAALVFIGIGQGFLHKAKKGNQ